MTATTTKKMKRKTVNDDIDEFNDDSNDSSDSDYDGEPFKWDIPHICKIVHRQMWEMLHDMYWYE